MSALFVLDSLFASACDSSEPFDSFVRMLARSAGSLELGVGVFPRHPGTRRPLLGDERTICPRVRPRCVRGACAGGLATLTSQTSTIVTVDEEVVHVHVHVNLPSRPDAQPQVPWRHNVGGAKTRRLYPISGYCGNYGIHLHPSPTPLQRQGESVGTVASCPTLRELTRGPGLA